MGDAQYQTPPLEIPKVWNIKAPIARAGRDDHCRSLRAPAASEVKRNRRFGQTEAYPFGGYQHPGTEFLRLDIRQGR